MKGSPYCSANLEMPLQTRPWQLLVTGDGGTLLTQQDIEALTRILDLLPHVASLKITTSTGSARASRDFQGNYIQQADQILAGMFTRNPDVMGITFPASRGRSPHTATADDPHVLSDDKALTAIMNARQRGEITADEMIAQIRQLHSLSGNSCRSPFGEYVDRTEPVADSGNRPDTDQQPERDAYERS